MAFDQNCRPDPSIRGVYPLYFIEYFWMNYFYCNHIYVDQLEAILKNIVIVFKLLTYLAILVLIMLAAAEHTAEPWAWTIHIKFVS